MKETVIMERKKIKMKSPVLIEGLPGIGLVGKLAADHMRRELKAVKVADLYSPHFPHQVLMQKNGIVRMLKNKFYYVKGKKNDLLILVGDVQAVTSEAQYEITGKILEYCKEKGVRRIYTLGGYGMGKTFDAPRVLGAANKKELVPEYTKHGVVFGQSRGSIIGAAGMLLGLGKLKGIPGVCLMGETHGGYVDAKSAQVVLEMLCRILGIKVNVDKLAERAKSSEQFIKKLEKEAGKQQELGMFPTGKELSYIR